MRTLGRSSTFLNVFAYSEFHTLRMINFIVLKKNAFHIIMVYALVTTPPINYFALHSASPLRVSFFLTLALPCWFLGAPRYTSQHKHTARAADGQANSNFEFDEEKVGSYWNLIGRSIHSEENHFFHFSPILF